MGQSRGNGSKRRAGTRSAMGSLGSATDPSTVAKGDTHEIRTEAGPVRVTKRPTWRGSERTTKKVFEPESSEQLSFRDEERVATGKKGSVRPDLYQTGRSIEVKNYLVNTPARRSRLVRVVAKQARERASDLPKGTRQLVRLDLQGQLGVTRFIPEIAAAIEEQSGGIIRRQDVHWILSLYPDDSMP